MIKVDTHVPVPEVRPRGKPGLYPWKEMNIGDSFFVPNKKSGSFSGQVSQAEYRVGNGVKFYARPEEEGVRVWRIK